MTWFLYATCILTGMLFMAGSMWLAFCSMKAHKAGEVDTPGEFDLEIKFIKIKSSYPMLGMAMVGAVLVAYPIYDYGPSDIRPYTLKGAIVSDYKKDLTIKVMYGPWEYRVDTDGKFLATVVPQFGSVLLMVKSSGGPPLLKTVLIPVGSTAVDVGDLVLPKRDTADHSMPDLLSTSSPRRER